MRFFYKLFILQEKSLDNELSPMELYEETRINKKDSYNCLANVYLHH
jgi:hypothetical protein